MAHDRRSCQGRGSATGSLHLATIPSHHLENGQFHCIDELIRMWLAPVQLPPRHPMRLHPQGRVTILN